jgi:hypothetical protein
VTVEAAEARLAVNEAALARDRTALVALAASMPAIQAFAYERRRARAFAHALDGAGDAALAELSLAAAAAPPSAATLAADSAQLHLLLGDPARAVVALEGAARVAEGLDPHAGAVLVAAIREAPAAWFRGTRAAVLARSPRTTLAALGAAFDTVADRTVFRAGVAGAALAAAVLSFFTLPTVFFDGTSAAPRSGVTTPRSSAPPDVVVADVPLPAASGHATPERTRPTRPEASAATLVSVRTTQPAADALEEEQQPPPGRPRASRPAPAAPQPPAPAPEPSPAPPPTPAPAPAATPVEVPVASAAAAAPAAAPPPATVDRKKAKDKVKRNDKEEKQHEHKTEEPAPPPPPPPAAAAQPPAECEREDEHEHGRDREKDKEKRRDG